ncbi:hypothetical protein HPB49_004181 [Dermacentor silvarum]|uniref:Uncharacterized protein n=1 Tax=Dermacentor silvarum TaxID=543639 RepID=A0ACB8DMZ3_DERSI|nr:hypothetical protein HPB49_004181 [Dermacentor silvarum]
MDDEETPAPKKRALSSMVLPQGKVRSELKEMMAKLQESVNQIISGLERIEERENITDQRLCKIEVYLNETVVPVMERESSRTLAQQGLRRSLRPIMLGTNDIVYRLEDGKVVQVPLPVPRLRPGSVPTVFPACPSYLSKEKQSSREAPDIKRSRQDSSELARAIQESVASYEAEEERQHFSTHQEMKACLQAPSVPDVWNVVHTEMCTMFLYIVNESEACLTVSNLLPAIKEFQSKG